MLEKRDRHARRLKEEQEAADFINCVVFAIIGGFMLLAPMLVMNWYQRRWVCLTTTPCVFLITVSLARFMRDTPANRCSG